MARTRRAQKPRAQKCRLSTCKRTVRVDNPTFPYCHDHVHLKTLRSSVVNLQAFGMDEVRNTIYNPFRCQLPRAVADITTISNSAGLLDVDVAHSYKAWVNNTVKNGIDTTDPIDAYTHRDDILSGVSDDLGRYCDVHTVSCHAGKIVVPGIKQPLSVDDHTILVATHDDETFVVDPATAAPLHSIDEKIRERYPDRTLVSVYGPKTTGMPCFDGLNVSTLTEYAAFNYTTYKKFTDDTTGQVVWDNHLNVEEDGDTRAMRLAVQNTHYHNPVVQELPNSFNDRYVEEHIRRHDDHDTGTDTSTTTRETTSDDLTLEEILASRGINR